MAATGDEVASIAQAAKALDVDSQNSGATGDEAVSLRQLKMLRDNMGQGLEPVQIKYLQNANLISLIDENGMPIIAENPKGSGDPNKYKTYVGGIVICVFSYPNYHVEYYPHESLQLLMEKDLNNGSRIAIYKVLGPIIDKFGIYYIG